MRAAGLALGVLADAALGDPRRGHPVALFGRAAARLEQATYRDDRAAGALHWGLCVLPVVGLGVAAERCSRRSPVGHTLAVAAATFTVLGGTSLRREGQAMAALIARGSEPAGDLGPARLRLSHLCAREASGLSADELSRATVESLAENTSDAVVAPLLWGALGGIPGLLGYRAVNTLDAMVGYRSARYERFGWACARADDLANLAPARLCALLVAALAPTEGGDPRRALATWREHAGRHPSPNAGPVEAAWAGALGVRLGGRSRYHGRDEQRGHLGHGRSVAPGDIERSVRLSARLGVLALGVGCGIEMVRRVLCIRGRSGC